MAPTKAKGRTIKGLSPEQRQAQRRDQLLDAALTLFASKGYGQTSIEQICQTAYVGTKGFYELFDSKEACYLALLDSIVEETAQKLVTAVEPPPATETEATHTVIRTFAHAMSDDHRKVRAAFGEGAGISPEVDRQRRANRRWGASFVEQIWEHYGVAQAATRRGIDVHHAAVALIGGLFDLVVDWLLDAERDVGPGDIDVLVDRLSAFYDLVRRGLDG